MAGVLGDSNSCALKSRWHALAPGLSNRLQVGAGMGGTAPVEGRIAGIVDIPNVCATLAIPTAIFDFDINPNSTGPTKQVTGPDVARTS